MIGTRLAHYEITALLGKGGMGEVYRAVDGKLGREVALKVLPTEVSGDPERAARFEREARTLATLQHSNVASVYGFEEVQGTRFLVMELVEGQDLSALAVAGTMSTAEIVDVARQIATGLEAAHERGIVHRDLKPANVMLTDAGEVKILDFGLARAWFGDAGDPSTTANSPTITAAMTQAGTILGTAAYMSPEQARGKSVDRRADIWAFGAILWEMLTGRQLFAGETVSDTLAAVLRAEPEWELLPRREAPELCRLVERCLVRDPQRRLRDIGDARIALEDLKDGRSRESAPQVAVRVGLGRERGLWLLVVAVLVAAIAAMAWLRETVPEPGLVQSTLLPPAGWDFAPASPFAVSPDGSQIAFVAIARPENEDEEAGSNSIWIRDLASPESRRLTGTNGQAFPFWSPDGRWLGFYAGGKLGKIEARGGPVVPICDATDGRGGTWSQDGIIVFQRAWSEGLMKVSAGGGIPEPATTLDKSRFDVAHRWPQFLPDGRHFLFYVVSTTSPLTSELSGIYLGSLDSSETQLLLKSESRALYSRGHLLYRLGSTLMAQAFDASVQRIEGDPVPVATEVPGGAISWGGAQFGTSEAGVLVHMRGAGAAQTLLRWRDREGKVLGSVVDPGGYWEPRLSNDGTHVALAVGQDSADIWIFDLERDMRTRFSFEAADDRTPLWSPDDRQLAYVSGRNNQGEIWVRPVSGSEDAELIFTAGTNVVLSDWSRDGRLIFFDRLELSEDDMDVWTLDVESLEAKPLLSGRFVQQHATLSPDGRWLAFVSNESGRFEVYVQSFPEAAGRWMVSGDSGSGSANRPVWRSDGRELFYLRGGTIVSVPVTGEETFSFGTPKPLFNVRISTASSDFAVSKDGQRILTNEIPPADPSEIGARLIQNWSAALRR